MAFTPDLPFPKNAGDPIKSKDWNDLVNETKRLDTAKVERGSDAITGSLSVAGTLAVGKTVAAATAKLDVAGNLAVNDNNLLLRVGTDGNHGLGWFGTGKLFAGANVDGPVLWGNLGGALGTAPGGVQKVALSWDGNGNVAIGVPSTALKVDIGDRIRLRQRSTSTGSNDTAGLWLYQTTPAEDRAFVGMQYDNRVGFYGNKGAGWSLTTDVTNGNVGVRGVPNDLYAMYLNTGAVGGVTPYYGLVIGGGASAYGLVVTGRSYDQSVRTSTYNTNQISTTSTSYVAIPGMSLSIAMPAKIGKYFCVMVQVNGVQATGSSTIGTYFRLMVDGVQQDFTRQEFNHNGWELRGVTLARMIYLSGGTAGKTYNITVDWCTTSGTLTCCWYGDSRQIIAIEL